VSDSAPVAVVEPFLERLRAADVDGAVELLADDLRYENTGLPTVRGRERVRSIFGSLNRFDVRDGRIALWLDRFDYMTTLLATLRGLVGVVVPAARSRPPKGA